MQDYTRLKAQALVAVESGGARERDDVAWLLVLEQLIFQTEAEARWLDHCESRLIRLSAAAPAPAPAANPAPHADAPTAASASRSEATAATAADAPSATARPGAEAAPPVAGAR